MAPNLLMYQWNPLLPQPLWWSSSHSSVSSERFIFYFRFSLTGLKIASRWEWELVSRNGKDGFPHSSSAFSNAFAWGQVTSSLTSILLLLYTRSIFSTLEPGHFLSSGKLHHTLKLYIPLPELGLNKASSEVLAAAHSYMGWQCLHILALHPGCNKPPQFRSASHTHSRWRDDYELWAVLIRSSLFSQDDSPTGWGSTGALLEIWAVSTSGMGGGGGQMPPCYPLVCTWLQVSFSASSF